MNAQQKHLFSAELFSSTFATLLTDLVVQFPVGSLFINHVH